MTAPVLFLDDASSSTEPVDDRRALLVAKTLIATLRKLRRINNRIALNTARPISQYQIAPNVTLQAVLRGGEFREEWDFIRGLRDRSPFASGLAEDVRQAIENMEFRTHQGQVRSNALAWAALMDSATVSFDGHPDWSRAWVVTCSRQLNDEGDLIDAQGEIRNASQIVHADEHVEWLKQLGLADQPSAAQIWGERLERYPGLHFLPRVEHDLLALDGSGIVFLQALVALDALANDVANWMEGPWPSFSRKASPEGEQRKRLCRVHDETTGRDEFFDWHIRFTGNFPGRVHFRVDGTHRHIVVAYVGSKLDREISG